MSEELNKKKSDRLLELALEEWLEQDPEMARYEDAETKRHHEFSEEHKRRMKSIFKMADKVERKAERSRRNIRFAAGFTLFLCLSTVAVTQVEAFRLSIMKVIFEIKEKSALIGSYTENKLHLSGEYGRYEPSYVPDGYVVVDVKEYDSGFHIKYESENDSTWYRYYCWNQKENVDADIENGDLFEIEINGHPAIVVQKEDEIRISLNNESKRFYLNGSISFEEAVKIFSSIEF